MGERDYSDLLREELEARVDVLWNVREILGWEKGTSVRERARSVVTERDRLRALVKKLSLRLYDELERKWGDPGVIVAVEDEDPDVREALIEAEKER